MWGCLAKVIVPTPKKMRIGLKTVNCISIGYAHNRSAYQFLVYKSKNPDIHKNTIMESMNTSFFEHVFPCKEDQPSSSKRTFETVVDNSQTHEENESVKEEPRMSKKVRIEKSFGPNFLSYMLEAKPQTYKKVVSSIESSYGKRP